MRILLAFVLVVVSIAAPSAAVAVIGAPIVVTGGAHSSTPSPSFCTDPYTAVVYNSLEDSKNYTRCLVETDKIKQSEELSCLQQPICARVMMNAKDDIAARNLGLGVLGVITMFLIGLIVKLRSYN